MSNSNSSIDIDGFQKVKTKRLCKRISTKLPPKDIKFDHPEVCVNVDKVILKVNSAVEDLRLSSYLKEVLTSVSNVLQDRSVTEIVCFGLGHISECNISQYQLALLLCLKEQYTPVKVLTHDPIFYKGECEILKKLDCEVIPDNNEGGYVISNKGVTIVYLPHCPKQLTNNFLWSNWSVNLTNCVLLCNSFTSLIDNQPSRILSETVSYIFNIFPYTKEYNLENNFKFYDIFNDTSIHTFCQQKLENLNVDFWKNNKKPNYQDTEEFITCLMLKKLNI